MSTQWDRSIFIMLALLISMPVHEFGHYSVAYMDGAEILDVNYFSLYDGTQFTNQGAVNLTLLCAMSGLAIIPVLCDSTGIIGSVF